MPPRLNLNGSESDRSTNTDSSVLDYPVLDVLHLIVPDVSSPTSFSDDYTGEDDESIVSMSSRLDVIATDTKDEGSHISPTVDQRSPFFLDEVPTRSRKSNGALLCGHIEEFHTNEPKVKDTATNHAEFTSFNEAKYKDRAAADVFVASISMLRRLLSSSNIAFRVVVVTCMMYFAAFVYRRVEFKHQSFVHDLVGMGLHFPFIDNQYQYKSAETRTCSRSKCENVTIGSQNSMPTIQDYFIVEQNNSLESKTKNLLSTGEEYSAKYSTHDEKRNIFDRIKLTGSWEIDQITLLDAVRELQESLHLVQNDHWDKDNKFEMEREIDRRIVTPKSVLVDVRSGARDDIVDDKKLHETILEGHFERDMNATLNHVASDLKSFENKSENLSASDSILNEYSGTGSNERLITNNTRIFEEPDLSDLSYVSRLLLIDLWHNDEATVLDAIRDLVYLLKGTNEENLDVLQTIHREIGGFSTVIGAVRKWYANENIQSVGLEFLRLTLESDWSWGSYQIAQNTLTSHVVLAAMKNYPDNEDIQQAGCGTLNALTRMNYDNSNYLITTELEIIRIIIKAMKSYPLNNTLRLYVCKTLYKMSRWDVLRQPIRKAGGIRVLKKTLTSSQNNSELQKWVNYTIRRLGQ